MTLITASSPNLSRIKAYVKVISNGKIIIENDAWIGAGDPRKKYGVRDFKKQFGGQMVEFGRYKKVYSPRMLKLLEKGLNIYKIKKLIK